MDGDTIVLDDGERVRYIGIDTPETVHPRKPVEWMGKEAGQANRLLVEGKRVGLEYDVQRRDKYGRKLAYVYVGNVMVNELLVRAGYAQVSTYPPNVKHQERFLRAQRQARDEQLGLWGDGTKPGENPVLTGLTPTLEEKTTKAPPPLDGETVYVTGTGKKYHRAGCQYLRKSQSAKKKSEAIAEGYGVCKKCGP